MLENIIKLSNGVANKEYTIYSLSTEDKEFESFLFTLGCFEGEKITIVSPLHNNFIVSIKDARYSIDIDLAACINVTV